MTAHGVLAGTLLGSALLVPSPGMRAEPVVVRYPEGLVRGFLSLRTLEGDKLADGELIQFSKGARVTSRLVFRFADGSVHDETVVFSQRGRFRMLRNHLIQKGPAFPHPLEAEIDGTRGDIKLRYRDEEGREKLVTEHLDLPPDVCNGLLLTLMKNIAPDAPRTTLSMVVVAPKPRLVKLFITPRGEEPFTTDDTKRKAMHYLVKVEIGGITGVVAPLLGKQPPDSHVWILGGEAPAFVKSEGPLAMGGDSWRIELASPTWPP